uniref:BTB/POZ domain-containing protein 17 isoform X2 n=1 Tax=Petromyzon marinus TaxID=7757 RepID=A0AAJ7TPE1_PETMA|nr:BTB/POZ domain-containing protein 17 isoform X2 [Petromyzon marinus]
MISPERIWVRTSAHFQRVLIVRPFTARCYVWLKGPLWALEWRAVKRAARKRGAADCARGVPEMLFARAPRGLAALLLSLCMSGVLNPASAGAINQAPQLLEELSLLVEDANSSDTELRVLTEGAGSGAAPRRYPAHRVLLALRSRAFSALLANGSGSLLHLTLSPDCASVFSAFLRYLYTGKIVVNVEQVIPLCMLAFEFKVDSLRLGLSKFMTENLSQSPVVAWYEFAWKVGDQSLVAKFNQFIAWNLSSVISSPEWAAMSGEHLHGLLQRSDLVLDNELSLFSAVAQWIERNQPNSSTAEALLKSIRFPMMTPVQILQLKTESTVLKKYEYSINNLLDQSFQFHSVSPVQFAKYFDVKKTMFIPRNYLSPPWGTLWAIQNPARDDRSIVFQTQTSPSNFDYGKKISWNVVFSPRKLKLEQGVMQQQGYRGSQSSGGHADLSPRLHIIPASPTIGGAGVKYQKTVLIGSKRQGRMIVKQISNFYQSTDEMGNFLKDADIVKRSSEYLVDNALHLHIIVKPMYQPIVDMK